MSVLCLSIFCTYHDTHSTPLQNAVGGALNVIRQAADAGIKHISFTGSIGAFAELAEAVIRAPVTEKDWNPYAEEQAFTSPHPMMPYLVSKKFAEQALWKLVDEYPNLNLTTSKPPSVSSCADPLERFSSSIHSAPPWLSDRTPKSTS